MKGFAVRFTVEMRISLLTALLVAGAVQAETLHQKDGITLTGTIRVVGRGVATCRVSEANHTPQAYERMKIYHGQPMNVWRMDFAVYNESGQWLEHMTANLKVSSEAPPCTSWSGPEVVYPKTVQWGGSYQVLQRPYGMRPGDEARDVIFVLTLHDQEPSFKSWDIDYGFAAGSTPPPTRTTPSVPTTAGDAQTEDSAHHPVKEEQVCSGQPEETPCWKELASHTQCYVWDDFYTNSEKWYWFHDRDQKVTWTAGCSAGVASGTGTLKWGQGRYESMGTLLHGKANGNWILRERESFGDYESERVEEGPYKEGKANGNWILRSREGGDEEIEEGPYKDGLRHGRWIEQSRWEDNTEFVEEGPYKDGLRHGDWVMRWGWGFVGGGSYLEGKRHGHWIDTSGIEGNVQEGPYVEGKRNGHWVQRVRGSYVMEGPYVEGKKHGQWILRSEKGCTARGSYVHDKKPVRVECRDRNGIVTFYIDFPTY